MWVLFAGAVLICVAILYVPGYFVARAFPFGRFSSAVVAPMFSCAALTLLGVILSASNLSCPAYFLLLCALAACILIWAIPTLVRRAGGGRSASGVFLPVGVGVDIVLIAAFYLIVAVIVVCIVFLSAIGTADAFGDFDDSTVHYGIVQGFLQTGTYSTLNAGSYMDQGIAGGYYPAQWHIPVAIIASFFNNNVALGFNAMIFTFEAVVLPLAILLLLQKLFAEKRVVVICGSLVALAFGAFPWGFTVFGQLLPNMMSFAFVPMLLVILVEATSVSGAGSVIKAGVAVLLGLISIALAHPNGLFTFGVWALAFCVSRLFFEPGAEKAVVSMRKIAIAAMLVIVAAAIWTLLYFAPFMQSIVQENWASSKSVLISVLSGCLFMFAGREGAQPLLFVFVVVGFVYVCRNRKHLWLGIAFAFAFGVYLVDSSAEGFIKHFLSGFWYTDKYRTGAMASLFAVPLAALGVAWLWAWFKGLLEFKKDCMRGSWRFGRCSSTLAGVVSAAALVALMVITQAIPAGIDYDEEKSLRFGLAKIHRELSFAYSWDRGLTYDEFEFVKRALAEVPEGSLVINVPQDGSGWVYGLTGIDTYFRRPADVGMTGDFDSKVLRSRLRDYATDKEVQEVVRRIDAQYVLLLDAQGSEYQTFVNTRFEKKDWVGIQSISEGTLGFSLVLSDGDKRLYKIER